MKYTNALIHESSPYLLQHAHNPVNWYPWGEEAIGKATREDKMLIISIGYAACHWCHVMEHESFEDEEVAAIMNEHFVSIKVDREERPDVDMIYMNAAQLINGSGGWPLNALALPDGKPFFAATYFPPDRWKQLLLYFVKEYRTNASALHEQARHLAEGIAGLDRIPFSDEAPDFSMDDMHPIHDALLGRVDHENGGLASNMKFAMPSVWEWLLQYHYTTGDVDALKAVFTTLDRMKDGGIYDQIGGGFARYATDPYWHVPHFEKMLYDNAQLISLYSHACQVSRNAAYKKVCYETIEFIQRELSDGTVFYSSLDADSDKEEGKFYVWTIEEIREALGENAQDFCDYFGITAAGNWEDGKNIPDKNLSRIHGPQDIAAMDEIVAAGKEKLRELREKRVRPALDDKAITSWNALMASALLQAARAFADERLRKMARTNMEFIIAELWDENDKILYRNYKNGKRSVAGFLDDYAFTISALIELYQSTFEFHYLETAKKLAEVVMKHFIDASNQMFFYNDFRSHNLINRPVEINDNVIPSSNSVMAENIFLLGTFYDDHVLIRHAGNMVRNMKKEILSNPVYQTYWARVMMKLATGLQEVAIVGAEWQEKLRKLDPHYLPDTIFCGGEESQDPVLLKNKYKEGHTMIYVCRQKTCQSPVTEALTALQQVKAGKNT